jgi:tetratricopeptide (TPR) repeat protein
MLHVMKSRFFRFPIFALVGIAIALCFAVKPLYGGIALLGAVVLYGCMVQIFYRRMTRSSQLLVDEGMDALVELEPATVYARRAQKRWQDGNHAGAIADFELAIAEDVCSAETYYQYAMLLLETGNAIDGVARLEQAINRARSNGEADTQERAVTTLHRLHNQIPLLTRL